MQRVLHVPPTILWKPWVEWTSSHQCTRLGCSSSFGDEPKTHPLPLPRDVSAPFSASKFSPLTSILPSPSYLYHLISCSLHLQSSRELPSLSSTNLRGNVRHKAWGRWSAQHWRTWRGEGKRSTSSQMQNWEKKLSSLLSLHFFLLYDFFSLRVFFSFLLLEKKKTSSSFSFSFCFYLKWRR